MDADDEELPPLVISCVGPPLCTLQGDAAHKRMREGCVFCRRFVVLSDGSIEPEDGSRGTA